MATAPAPLWKQILNIRRDELPQSLLMFGYFFLVITTFWILKPLKKGIFVQFYDRSSLDLLGWQLGAAQAEQIAKVGNMFVALAAAALFAYLSRRLRRQYLTYAFGALIIVGCLGFVAWLRDPGPGAVWSFYFFGDLYTTVMVATFFAYLNDSVRPDTAKRIYGLIVLGGVAGGAFGATFLSAYIERFSLSQWLLISAALTGAVILLAGAAAPFFRRRGEVAEEPAFEEPAQARQARGNPALEGARLALRSRYLFAIVAIVGLYEMVSTVMDFQFTATVAHYLSGDAIGQHFALVFAITNWVGLFVQLFLTSFVMTRFGVGAALLFLPIAALSGSTAFLVFPILWTGSLLNTADNAFNYSINQSARETLYVPTSREAKYQAKAFIDMFVQRFAKAIAVGLSLAITLTLTGFEGVRYLSILTGLILIAWIQIVRYAGREFDRLTSPEREEEEPLERPAPEPEVATT